MNWLKTLWNKLVKKTSVSPTLVVVEEESLLELLVEVLQQTGVDEAYTRQHLAARYEEWYEGEHNIDAIYNSLNAFKTTLPAGMSRKINHMQRSKK
tara:strand:+ start:401 stop:688 length:288 start_codon:yes stop_codon:yes gene_type:complete